MTSARILLVHPDPSILALIASMLQSSGHQIDEVTNDPAAVRRLDRGGVDLILAGANPSDPDSLELLSLARRKYPRVPFLLLFPGLFPERAREAMRMGALSVLKFPISANELRAAVLQACDSSPGQASPPPAPVNHGKPYRTNGDYPRINGDHRPGADSWPGLDGPARANRDPAPPSLTEFNEPPTSNALLGEDAALRQSIELADTVASTRASVVIVGEQGTGKTLLARAIHRKSGRRDRALVEVACTGVDEFILERELFGQKFDNAEVADRAGFLERANGGTLLFEDVSALSMPLQERLLAVLQAGAFTPMGGSRPIPIDVRFLFATRENLPTLVEQGKFHRELHERINDVCVKMPPLRQRDRDLIRLAELFRDRFVRQYAKTSVEFSPEAIELISRHDWPGNVRELESVIQRGVAMSQGSRINPGNLSLGSLPSRAARATAFAPRNNHHAAAGLRPLKQALEEPEKQIIIQTLRALNWNRQETARVLDINRTTLYKKMKKYGLLMEEPALLN